MRLGVVSITTAALGMACSSTPSGPTSVELLTYDAEVRAQALDSVSVAFPFQLDNTTASGAEIEHATWTFKLEHDIELKGEQKFEIDAAGGTQADGEIVVSAELPVTDEAFDARAGLTRLRFELLASFDIGTGSGAETYEAEWYGEIFPPKRPEVTLGAEAARYDNNIELNFVIGIKNTNPFVVTIDSLDYVLEVKQTELSKGQLAAGQELETASELQYSVTRFVGRDDLHDLARTLIREKLIPYKMTAQLTVGGNQVETPLEGELRFER